MVERTVLHVGTSLETKGGISATERALIAAPPEGWRAEHIATHQDGSPFTKVHTWRRGAKALKGRLAASPPDVLHVHTASDASWWRKRRVLAYAAAAGMPAVLAIHGGGFAEFCARRGGRAGREVQAAVARRRVRPVVLTPAWTERLSSWLDAAAVVPNPGPVPSPDPFEAREPDRLIFVTRDDHAKGVDLALQAFAAARAVRPELSMRIAGLGAGDKQARGQPTEGVTFLGWIDRDILDAELARASLQISPSRLEGFPMAVLDALAHALPVLASQVAGDALGDAGEVLDHLDPQRWGQRIAELVTDREALAAMAEAAPARLAPYQIGAVRAAWAEVYASLIDA